MEGSFFAPIQKFQLSHKLCAFVHYDRDAILPFDAREYAREIVRTHSGGPPNGDNKLVLIGHVEFVKAAQFIVPARVRLEFLDLFDDLFAGVP